MKYLMELFLFLLCMFDIFAVFVVSTEIAKEFICEPLGEWIFFVAEKAKEIVMRKHKKSAGD